MRRNKHWIVSSISLFIILLLLSACSDILGNSETAHSEAMKDNEVTTLRDSPNKKINAKLISELFQSNGEETMEFETLTIKVLEDEEGSLGTFLVDLHQPQKEYEVDDDTSVKLDAYFPSYYMNDDLEPASYSDYPLNPAFALKVVGPEQTDAIFLGIGIEVVANENSSIYSLEIVDFTAK